LKEKQAEALCQGAGADKESKKSAGQRRPGGNPEPWISKKEQRRALLFFYG
jgi:hypothetical protein